MTIPYSDKEMTIINAIFDIDRNATFKIKGKLETREDYMYGGIEWLNGYNPIPYEQILEKILEKDNENKNVS